MSLRRSTPIRSVRKPRTCYPPLPPHLRRLKAQCCTPWAAISLTGSPQHVEVVLGCPPAAVHHLKDSLHITFILCQPAAALFWFDFRDSHSRHPSDCVLACGVPLWLQKANSSSTPDRKSCWRYGNGKCLQTTATTGCSRNHILE